MTTLIKVTSKAFMRFYEVHKLYDDIIKSIIPLLEQAIALLNEKDHIIRNLQEEIDKKRLYL